jgi:hypothetical protein
MRTTRPPGPPGRPSSSSSSSRPATATRNHNDDEYDSYDEDDDDQYGYEDEEEEEEERALSQRHGEAAEEGSRGGPNGSNRNAKGRSKKRGTTAATDQEIADEYAAQEKTTKRQRRTPAKRTAITPEDLIQPRGLTVVRHGIANRFHRAVGTGPAAASAAAIGRRSGGYPRTVAGMAKYSRHLVAAYQDWMEDMTGGISLQEGVWRLHNLHSKAQVRQYLQEMRNQVRNDHVERVLGLEQAESVLAQLADYYQQQQHEQQDAHGSPYNEDDNDEGPETNGGGFPVPDTDVGDGRAPTSVSPLSEVDERRSSSTRDEARVGNVPPHVAGETSNQHNDDEDGATTERDPAIPPSSSTNTSNSDPQTKKHALDDSSDEEEAVFDDDDDDGVVGRVQQETTGTSSLSSHPPQGTRRRNGRRPVLDDEDDEDIDDDDDTAPSGPRNGPATPAPAALPDDDDAERADSTLVPNDDETKGRDGGASNGNHEGAGRVDVGPNKSKGLLDEEREDTSSISTPAQDAQPGVVEEDQDPTEVDAVTESDIRNDTVNETLSSAETVSTPGSIRTDSPIVPAVQQDDESSLQDSDVLPTEEALPTQFSQAPTVVGTQLSGPSFLSQVDTPSPATDGGHRQHTLEKNDENDHDRHRTKNTPSLTVRQLLEMPTQESETPTAPASQETLEGFPSSLGADEEDDLNNGMETQVG